MQACTKVKCWKYDIDFFFFLSTCKGVFSMMFYWSDVRIIWFKDWGKWGRKSIMNLYKVSNHWSVFFIYIVFNYFIYMCYGVSTFSINVNVFKAYNKALLWE